MTSVASYMDNVAPLQQDLPSGTPNSFDSVFSLIGQLQKSLSSLQNEVAYSGQKHSTLAMDSAQVPGHSFSKCDYAIQVLQHQVLELKNEVACVKHQISVSSKILSGPSILVACLLAISLFAISIIVLGALGLAGILPQVVSLLSTQDNVLWAVVSASIIAVICLTSVFSVFCIKPTKPVG